MIWLSQGMQTADNDVFTDANDDDAEFVPLNETDNANEGSDDEFFEARDTAEFEAAASPLPSATVEPR